MTNETWFPDAKQTGADYTLPEGLAPLARHKADFTVIQGCSNKYANEAHWGSTFWLTGANRYALPGQSFANSISADQVAMAHLGQETRYASIQLNSPDVATSGHGPGLSLAWDLRGKPLAGIDDPVAAFHRLFSDDSTPLSERQSMLAQKRSVLDAVLSDAKRVQRGLTTTDTDKLDEYFQSIRDIEVRLGKDEQWLGVPKAGAAIPEPKPGLAGKAEIQVMYDLIVRSWRAMLGGKPAAPHVSTFCTEWGKGNHKTTVELSPPPGLTELQPGDFVEAELELVVFPADAADYYGPDNALRDLLTREADTWRPVHREAKGNGLQPIAKYGRITKNYPLIIAVDDEQRAQVTVKGGLGHMPVVLTGLKSPGGHRIFVNDQPLTHWQTDYDAASGTWTRTYNVPVDDAETHVLRLTK